MYSIIRSKKERMPFFFVKSDISRQATNVWVSRYQSISFDEILTPKEDWGYLWLQEFGHQNVTNSSNQFNQIELPSMPDLCNHNSHDIVLS